MKLSTGERVAGRYEIKSLLGKGAMGAVYLARDSKFGQDIALKVATVRNDVFRKRFEREARIGHLLGKLDGFVRALDWGEFERGLYLALDYVADAETLDLQSGSLDDRLKRVARACRLVSEAHQQGIVHRDIKPTNFLQTRDGQIYLTDFGLSKTSDSVDVPEMLSEDEQVTKTGMILGTPNYMSPEQFTDSKSFGELGDVWALGVMLYRALTGVPPFEGKFSALLLEHEKIRMGKSPPPRPSLVEDGLPKQLDDLCARALELEPGKRPSAGKMADVLEGYLAQEEEAYVRTLADTQAAKETRRPPSGRNELASDRAEARRRGRKRQKATSERVDSVHVRSFTPAPPRWERWMRSGTRWGIYLLLGGIPSLCIAALVLDAGAIQAKLPRTMQLVLGDATTAAYGQLQDAQIRLFDRRDPVLQLRGAPRKHDWTTEDRVQLKIEVEEAGLAALSVNGEPVSVPAKYRALVDYDLPLPSVGKHEVVLEAVDRAGHRTRLRHTIWRVDSRQMIGAVCKSVGDDVEVTGQLHPAVSREILVGDVVCPVNEEGRFTKRLSVDGRRLRLKVTSARGDEVVTEIKVP